MKPKFRYSRRTFASHITVGRSVFFGFAVIISGLDEGKAGDILRGGGGGSTAAPAAGTGSGTGVTTPADTAQARANAQDALARNTNAINAVRAMQAAARAAAISGPNNLQPSLPPVTNGLGTGGLQTAPGVGTDPTQWQGAELPKQTTSAQGLIDVGIRQTAQQALLQWQTFNVGKNTTVTFDQSAAGANANQWIAFNKINDPTGNPSQILGQIKAQGQVYVINPNGVIFGGSSRVDVNTLTVSSLPINTSLIERGLLNNPDAQFLFSGLNLPAGLNGTPAFTPDKPASADGKYGDIVVQAGAQLLSPTSATKTGGRIALIGPNVTNHGTILTPQGQTILASGLQVGFDGHSSADPGLRGLDVFVGAVSDPTAGLYTGTTTQSGIIEAPLGSITIAGRDIRQNGVLASTTSVALNGRVDIQANYNATSNRSNSNARGDLFLFKDSGAVDLGPASIIRILPEYEDKATTIGTQLSLRSQINIAGKTIHMGQNSLVAAPNALVSFAAGSWFFNTAGAAPTSTFVEKGGQVYLESGASINVAGTIGVPVSVAQNFISVDLRSAELADSPLQRFGSLRNATIEVDIRRSGDGWIGTPLANVSGFANLIQRSVGQLTVAGGEVSISAGGSVVLQKGSNIEVSGGSTLFSGAMVRTTKLISGGSLIDIGSASPDIVYDGLFDGSFSASNQKFGISEVFSSVLTPAGFNFEAGYTDGAAGGTLSISAPSMALDGKLSGQTTVGENQRFTPPTRSTLNIAFQARDTRYPAILPFFSPTQPTVTFTRTAGLATAAPFGLDAIGNPLDLRQDRKDQVALSPDLIGDSGFGNLNLKNHDGRVLVPGSVQLSAPAGGSIRLNASNIFIDGTVAARGGNLSFSTSGLTSDEANMILYSALPASAPPVVASGRGIFKLGTTGQIIASGMVADDRVGGSNTTLSPLFMNGGSVNILGYSANLSAGGIINVSGGARINGKGVVNYGNGGSLSITAGSEPGFSSALGGKLTLASDLQGYSGSKAGSLQITGPALQLGGSVPNASVTRVDPDEYARKGFGTISLRGIGVPASVGSAAIPGILVSGGARVNPVVSGWLGSVGADQTFRLAPFVREETVRTPVKLTLASNGASFGGNPIVIGEVRLEKGSAISTDAGGSVSLNGEIVTIGGSIRTPGGVVTVQGSDSFPQVGTVLNALPTVHITSTASISTAGRQVLLSDPLGLRTGQVFAGGAISVTGNIVAEAGALLDVSGASGILDLLPSQRSLESYAPAVQLGKSYVPVKIDTNGGTITLAGSQMLFSDATLRGRAGGQSATGGTLTVSSGRFLTDGTAFTTADATLIVKQAGKVLPSPIGTSIGVGLELVDATGKSLKPQGNFAISSMASGGFDSFSLGGNVSFQGDVTVTVPGRLDVADGGVIYSTGSVRLSAGQVSLGQDFLPPTQQNNIRLFNSGVIGSPNLLPYQFAPRTGPGSLTVTAGLVDIGTLSLDGIGLTYIDARSGDIRGNGTFQMAGNLTLQAGQIYPTTQRPFDVFAYDAGVSQLGSVTILPGTLRSLPYSAGGSLSIQASRITQSGTLHAPGGSIRLGWDGSGMAPVNLIAGNTISAPRTALLTLADGGTTSVSLIDPVTGKSVILPYGISFDGSTWIDPAGNDITITGPPTKEIQLAATSLLTEEGSTVDIRGGGDLFAYRFIAGNGGSRDVLASSESFAIIPGYGFNYSPYSPFNSALSASSQAQAGFENSSLRAGDRITLAASGALPAGTYTLLPARYALYPGAVLVTPKSTVPFPGSIGAPDGSSIVAGYRSNSLDSSRIGATVIGGFEVAPAAVVRTRAQYQILLANTALRETTASNGTSVPRLPLDAGYLSLTATEKMNLRGEVSASSPLGRGGLVDINSSSDILINATGTGTDTGTLVIGAGTLNGFNTESLLIGGLRSFGPGGVQVSANSMSVTLDNAGAALTGKDIILVSREKLTLAENSAITSAEDDTVLDSIFLGDSSVPGSGDGALVRVSANSSGQVFRSGVSASNLPILTILGESMLTGGSLILDSTSRTSLADSARLSADDVALNSGRISIALNNTGILNDGAGLLLGGETLASLQDSAKRLSILSYSTIDTYGAGTVGSPTFEALSLQAGAIRGFNTGGGNVTFTASALRLGNLASSSVAALSSPLTGSLTFDADRITLGAGSVRLDGFAQNSLRATGIVTESEGSLDAAGNLDLVTPFLTGANASNYRISSVGTLGLTRPSDAALPDIASGFGASLTLQGSDVAINGDISLPSGKLTLRATSGNLVVGDLAKASLEVAGTKSNFVDAIRYTSGGSVNLISDLGSVILGSSAAVNVSAETGGGNAGVIQVNAPTGIFELAGSISGNAGANGSSGTFHLDTSSVANGSLAALDSTLNAGSFSLSREYRIRSGDVLINGVANARNYRVAADFGSITVTGVINASGGTGGSIDLKANGSLTLTSTSRLNASAQGFNSAGKGGSVTLEAGNQRDGMVDSAAVLDLQSGSVIELSVASKTAGSESLGMFSGTLHLRAPRNATNSDLRLNAIGSSIIGASSILVEGVKLYEVTGTGALTSTLQNTVKSDANAFLGNSGTTTAGYSAMLSRLTTLQPNLDLILAPGVEIINRSGDIALGSTSSSASADWNLATFRFGPRSAPGVLTIRASGDLAFFNALSDGFSAVTPTSDNGQSSLWLAPLMAANPLLPANTQSWSYHLTSGSDLSSVDFGSVLTSSSLLANKGSFLLGKNYGNAATYGSGPNHTTETSIERAGFQVIRTGSGEISIHSGRDAYILNQFASIYTAGTRVENPTTVVTQGDFVVPLLLSETGRHPLQGSVLGAIQQPYFVQYSMAGGNLSVEAANDVARMTRNSTSATGGTLIDDSSRQLPNNWLYRRGYVDPATGASGVLFVDSGGASLTDPNASTTWWVDFSNFFEGLGTLGGGNIQVAAGRDVKNIDAAAPTNARMALGTPSSSKLTELGGGDVTVLAGRDINAGVYYVERGQGQLEAGASIVTNATRSPSRGILASLTNPQIADSNTWLATTLFVGKGGFSVQASGDLLLGPVSNPFWLPQGINNKFWYKTYFNTYGAESRVDAISLGGSVTHRSEVSLDSTPVSALGAWISAHQDLSVSNGAASSQPWLRTVETEVGQFGSLAGIMAPTLRSTSLSGNINLVGDITLAPSPVGQIELIAKNSINGLQPSGFINNLGVQKWINSTLNLSDADPRSIPGITSPYAYYQVVGSAVSALRVTGGEAGAGFLQSILSRFSETGSPNGVLQDEQSRHTAGNLHAGDSIPVRIFAQDGNIEGLRLFSPKQARIIAGQDIGDIAFYIQNLASMDLSIVSAGRDLVAFNENTDSRNAARRDTASNSSIVIPTLAGDIQISGPGNLQVLAGRNLDLGFGSGNADGTGSGISSIGNARNPYLGVEGAGVTVGTGIGPAQSLSTSSLALEAFEDRFIKTEQGSKYLAEIAPGVDYSSLEIDERFRLALEIFYLVLRDTGRNFNDPESPGFRVYDNGFAAIATLFPEAVSWDGSILTRSRDIRTRSGGDIRILAPGGGLALANTTIGNPLTPPGIVTESGGDISIFTDGSVDIGIGRIFTLKGGNVAIWSSKGDIAAGSSSRTVSSAPPTRVIIDPQSASVETDLAGLATGGGIGVLATLEDVEAGDVDLIAPTGVIDAGDAGIRVSGNINLAAVTVVNAGNISAGGTSTGGNATVSAPSVATVTAASSSSAATAATASAPVQQTREEIPQEVATELSIFDVVVIGYGGGSVTDDEEEDEEKEKKKEDDEEEDEEESSSQ